MFGKKPEQTKVENKVKEVKTGLNALYAKFLSGLSSSEKESIKEKGLAQAMPAFRKYFNSLSDAEVSSIVSPKK